MEKMPTTKKGAEQRIREILAKHPTFKDAEITVNYIDKKNKTGGHNGSRT